ncbi:MAG: hypothetical protein HIU89_17555, partial [Proteobacteria bacterium]|nr:hypothetical protein [Pseudomonadota bacterium]
MKMTFLSISVGGYDNDDVRQLIINSGAAATVNTAGLRRLIVAVTHGHPLLVAAVFRLLIDGEWQLAGEVIGSLFDQAFAEDRLEVVAQRELHVTVRLVCQLCTRKGVRDIEVVFCRFSFFAAE